MLEHTSRNNKNRINITVSRGKSNRTGKTISRTYYIPKTFRKDEIKIRKTFKRGSVNNNIFTKKTKFNRRFEKILGKDWLDEVIGDVVSDCYFDIIAAAPVSSNMDKNHDHYINHIKMISPKANKYRSPDNQISVGRIYVEDVPVEGRDGEITYVDLAKFLEFGTGDKEITGSGNPDIKGIHPQPHWIPNYEIYKKVLKNRLKARLKEVLR